MKSKKSVTLFALLLVLMMLVSSVCVVGEIVRVSLEDDPAGASHSTIVSLGYESESPYRFYADNIPGGNPDVAIAIDSTNACEDLCVVECVGPTQQICPEKRYVCLSYKVGDSFRKIGECVNEGTGPYGYSKGIKKYDIKIFSSSAPYPGQLFVAISSDDEVDVTDDFYLIPAKSGGWLKGDNPEGQGLSSFDIVLESGDGVIGVLVNDIYDDSGMVIDQSLNTIEALVVGISSTNSITGNFLDSTVVYPKQKAILYYGNYSGDLYVFVNGILEEELSVETSNATKDIIKKELEIKYPDKEQIDEEGNYVTPELEKFKEIPISPRPDKLGKEVVVILEQPTTLDVAVDIFKVFLSIWVPMFIGIFAVLIIIYLKLFKDKRGEKIMRSVEEKVEEELFWQGK